MGEKMKLLIIGIQGSGKGTQSLLIAKELGLKHLSTGELLRNELKNDSEIGKRAKSFIEKGYLVPDEVVEEILYKSLPEDNYILDGYPRNVMQAKKLEKLNKPDRVIFLELKDKDVIERLSNRQSCPDCKEQYGLNRMPKEQGVCDKCGTRLVKRKDDNEESIRTRLKTFYSETVHLLDFYKERVIRVDGSGTVEEVFKNIKKFLLG